MIRALGVAYFIGIGCLFWLWFNTGVVFGQNPNCTEFGFQISTSCCCTNDCCREAEDGEVQHIRDDLYRIVPSGQEIRRTGWSPDGRTIRCSCDWIDGQWVKHSKAQTRCLYLPMPNS
jgi:hypothetical protein